MKKIAKAKQPIQRRTVADFPEVGLKPLEGQRLGETVVVVSPVKVMTAWETREIHIDDQRGVYLGEFLYGVLSRIRVITEDGEHVFTLRQGTEFMFTE